MALGGGRSKCVIKKVMPHNEFIDRIRKSLYFGGGTLCDEMQISSPLAEYASELFSEPHKGHSLNRLNKVTAGRVHSTPCSLIMALIYLDRLNAIDPSYVRRITPSELFIVSMMISTKFYTGHDEEIYLSDWAEDGGIAENRLKKLELEFLCAIDWNVYISNEDFFKKLQSVEETLARREGLRRGWLTYSEMLNLLPSFTLAKFFLNNITVMAVSYAASVITIAGAFFIASQVPGTVFHRRDITTAGGSRSRTNNSSDLLNTDLETVSNNTTVERNSTCSAINVEEELRKLETQYLEERLVETLHTKNNENAGPLINYNQNYLIPGPRVDITTEVNYWHNFKDDDDINYYDPANGVILTDLIGLNSTKNTLWNFISDAEKAFVQLPFMWFKFM